MHGFAVLGLEEALRVGALEGRAGQEPPLALSYKPDRVLFSFVKPCQIKNIFK